LKEEKLFESIANSDEIHKILDGHDSYQKEIAFSSPHVTPEHIHKALDDENEYVRASAISHPKASHENISKALDDESFYIRRRAIRHENVTPEHLDKAIQRDNPEDLREVAMSPKVQSHHLDKLLDHPETYVSSRAASSPNIQPHHIDKILDGNNHSAKNSVLLSDKLTTNHIHKILDGDDTDAKSRVLMNPNVKTEHIDKAINDPSSHVRKRAIVSPAAQSHHIDKALKDEDWGVRTAALQSDHLQSHHIDEILSNKLNSVSNSSNAMSVLHHPNVQPHHLDMALNHDDWRVRREVFSYYKTPVTPDHITKGLDDTRPEVRAAAAGHSAATDAHLDKALDDGNEHVVHAATSNPNLKPHHLDKAVMSSYGSGLDHLSNNNNLQPHHIDHILQHGSYDAKYNALQHKNFTSEHITKAFNNPETGSGTLGDILSWHKDKITPEHVTTLLNHPNADSWAKEKALSSRGATSDHIHQILDDPNAHDLHAHVVNYSDKFGKEHLDKVMNGNYKDWVKESANKKVFFMHDNTHLGDSVGDVGKHLQERQETHGKIPISKIPDEHKYAIKNYTDGSYGINSHLIHDGHDEEAVKNGPYANQVKNMDAAIDSHPLPKMTVYSGIKFHPHQKTTPDGLLKTTAYISTSINPQTSHGFTSDVSHGGERAKHILRIHVPEGHPGFFTGNDNEFTNHNEHEVILPRNTRYKISDAPSKSYADGYGDKIHMWDTHIVPQHVENSHEWEPPKVEK